MPQIRVNEETKKELDKLFDQSVKSYDAAIAFLLKRQKGRDYVRLGLLVLIVPIFVRVWFLPL